MKNYTLIETKFIDEINSLVSIYSHNKTKARICTIKNDDPNKVFSIAFRTPPMDDTGLTHILEHSVLCGSKKYPVKDPFVELIKGSLNTFLNAFTFPDKTMYPVASMNKTDFRNLMSVYLDAVFYPNIYNHEEIFMQEGWHYHLENKEDDITYNGVVYNEMKGAFSDAESVLFRKIMHSLYPDTAYGFESGGDPDHIYELSYKDFCSFHKKYYHPSNSYIFLYGDTSFDDDLEFIDENYLSNFEYNDFDTTIKLQEPFKEMVIEEDYYQIEDDNKLENNTYLSMNFSCGSTLDLKKSLALDVLTEVILQMPGAPLKEALLKSGICDDVSTTFESGILQQFLSVTLRKSDIKHKNKFIEIINNTLKNITLDKEALKAALNFREFKVREAKFDGPKGLLFQMTMLDSWLYDDNMCYQKLCLFDFFKELKEDIETNYFYDLINECILNNNHKSLVILKPSKTLKEEKDNLLKEKLNNFKKNLNDSELDSIISKTKNLIKYQETPSTKEELDSLPKLKITDLSSEPIKLNIEELDSKYKIYYSDYFTNDIGYVNYMFDISNIDNNDVCNIKLLSSILGLLNTKNRTYNEISKDIKLHTGGIYTPISIIPYNKNEYKIFLCVKFSMLKDEIKYTNSLVKDIIFNSVFDDKKRLYELICQIKNELEMSISGSGHRVSVTRCASYKKKYYKIVDDMSGIGYLDYLNDLINNYDDKFNDLNNKLNEYTKMIFNKNNFSIHLTCDTLKDDIINESNKFYDDLYDNRFIGESNIVLNKNNEGIKTSYNVNYVSKFKEFDNQYSGAMLVLKNAISLDYLWANVRVKGGAYGCMIQINSNNEILLTSYRDPNLVKTLDVYNNIEEFINSLDKPEEEILKYKIGAIGSLDDTMHVSTMGNTALNEYLIGLTYEEKKKRRESIINTNIEELKKLSSMFKEISKSDICVLGSKKDIEENSNIFSNIRGLYK